MEVVKNITLQHASFSCIESNRLAVADLNLYFNDLVSEELGYPIPVTETWFWFARLSVPPQIRNRGISKVLLSAVSEWADKHLINILLVINPYGDLNLNQLETLYSKYGFIAVSEGVMVRYV
jgi:GNAT superfamily N-acetyltransferase